MRIECCACGRELPVKQAIEAEEIRRLDEEVESIPVPPMGLVCLKCKEKYEKESTQD